MWFVRAFHGEARLWTVFWLMGFALILPMIIGIPMIHTTFGSSPKTSLGIMIFYILLLQGFHLLCVWKCAFNCGWSGWGYIARIIAVIAILGLLFQILGTARFLGDKNYQVTLSSDRSAPSESGNNPVPAVSITSTTVPAPAPSAAMPATAQAACEKRMADYAIANHGDPKAYIAQNQAYLQQCIASGGK